MSLLLKRTRRTPPGTIEKPEEMLELPKSRVMGSIKFVEVVGSLASLAASLSNRIIDYTIPDGYAAELLSIGIMPDWNVGAGASRLLDTEIGYDNKLTGIRFLTNHAGMNALPYGDRLSKQPMLQLGTPMKSGSLTPKFNEGMKMQVVVTAGSVAIADTVRARMHLLLYEPADCMSVFGVGISKLATIVGGVEQSTPERLFADYELLESATAGRGQWEDAYSKSIKDYEQIQLSHVGIKPHANVLNLKLYDLRAKREFPEYDPYFTIAETYNSLPFGDDDDYMPIQRLPDIIAGYIYSNTDFAVKVRDNNAVIPIGGMATQLLGHYRRIA
jgi:hypothetical protein